MMHFPVMSAYFLTCLVSAALAQSGGGTSATATASAASNVHTVAVGKDGLVFTPDTLAAAKGDIIEFTFGQGHSVELSTFSNPCNPVDTGAIYSGFPTASDMFTVTVNDTNPMWLYCSQTYHCQRGMVMVVNPPSSGAQTLAAYKAAAQSATTGKDPASVEGGIISPLGNAVASGTSISTSASASISTSISTSASASTSSPVSSGSSAAASPSQASAAAFAREVKWATVIAASLVWILRF